MRSESVATAAWSHADVIIVSVYISFAVAAAECREQQHFHSQYTSPELRVENVAMRARAFIRDAAINSVVVVVAIII
jgi:hypothetical protein